MSRRIAAAAFVALVVAVGASASAAAIPAAPVTPASRTFTSFSVFITLAHYWSYSSTLDVTASASFRDYDCTPSYSCDRNVLGEFTLRRGSAYGPIVSRTYDETGQYGSLLRAKFKVPSCRYIPKYRSITYVVVLEAAAPNGDEKQTQRYVAVWSCQR